MSRTRKTTTRRKTGRRILRLVLIRIPLAMVAASIALVFIFKWVPVRYTPLMLKRFIENINDDSYSNTRTWVSLDDISPNVIRAVMASEDGRFPEHNGFDLEELQKMKREHDKYGKKLRGCSTISQQTAKNCFTFGSRTWLRKGIEAYYTVLIELIWGKERIMEVYLNVAETGKGLFGIEAAAMKYYGRHASRLTLRQASAIACVLPAPLRRTPSYVASKMPERLETTVRRASRTTADLE